MEFPDYDRRRFKTLAEVDALIISAVEQQARRPLTEISKILGLKVHTVRYHLQELCRRGVLTGPIPLIDLGMLGYNEVVVYFSLISERQKLHDQLIEELKKRAGIVWFGGLGGTFQYGIHVSSPNPLFAPDLFEELGNKFRNPFHGKSIGVLLRFHSFGHKFAKVKIPAHFSFSRKGSKIEIDDLDRKILTALSVHGAGSIHETAKVCNVPFTTLERRVSELEQKKIIAGYIYRVGTHLLGFQRFKIQVTARGVNPVLAQKLLNYCGQHPLITNLIEFFGPWDYEIGVDAPGSAEIFELTRELFDKFGQEVLAITVVPVLSTLRFTSYPIGEAQRRR